MKQIQEGLRTKVLHVIGDPNIAYILMMIGLAGLFFELAHPGAVLPGVVGALCLILSFFAFNQLPVELCRCTADTSFPGFFHTGVQSDQLRYVDGCGGGLDAARIHDVVRKRRKWPSAITIGASDYRRDSLRFFIVIAALVVKAHTRRPKTGVEGIQGEVGVVRKPLTPEGKVFVHGELWRAVAGVYIGTGALVKVVGVRGIVIEVEPMGIE